MQRSGYLCKIYESRLSKKLAGTLENLTKLVVYLVRLCPEIALGVSLENFDCEFLQRCCIASLDLQYCYQVIQIYRPCLGSCISSDRVSRNEIVKLWDEKRTCIVTTVLKFQI